jgi:hypothetical protein
MDLNPSSNTSQCIMFIQVCAFQIYSVEWLSNNVYLVCTIHVEKARLVVIKFCIFTYKIKSKNKFTFF